MAIKSTLLVLLSLILFATYPTARASNKSRKLRKSHGHRWRPKHHFGGIYEDVELNNVASAVNVVLEELSQAERGAIGTNNMETFQAQPGLTYLAIGQDLFGISQYVDAQYNASLHSGSTANRNEFTPAAAMVYTDLETLAGLKKPIDYGSGVEYADGIIDSLFPGQGVGLQIGLWLNGTTGCRHIVAHEWDDQIKELALYIQNSQASKVFLRVGYEFDNPSFNYISEPSLYIEAFRIIVDGIRNVVGYNNEHSKFQGNKVQYVWHSWAATAMLELEKFYPGDSYVDWVGISVFQQLYPWSEKQGTGNIGTIENVIMFGQEHHKPIMIAESAPFGGVLPDHKLLQHMEEYNVSYMDPWEVWFEKIIRDVIVRYDVGLWSYINCDWDALSMWRGVGFGDTRLSTSEQVMMRWKAEVLDGKRFVGAMKMPSHIVGDVVQHDSTHAVPGNPAEVTPTVPATATDNDNAAVAVNEKVVPENNSQQSQPTIVPQSNNAGGGGKTEKDQSEKTKVKPTVEHERHPDDAERKHQRGGFSLILVLSIVGSIIYFANEQGRRELNQTRQHQYNGGSNGSVASSTIASNGGGVFPQRTGYSTVGDAKPYQTASEEVAKLLGVGKARQDVPHTINV
mmetsp:Transcript_4870/g.7091  ORF Transcript_4870/g.7091 Transcript_4870/m.7091 type:complete len:625 (-) Transcript_4870:79-1953(-)